MKHKRIWSLALVAMALVVGLAWGGAVRAAASKTSSSENNAGLVQGYMSDEPLQNGMIVRLKPKDATHVEALKSENVDDMFGVTVAPSEVPVSISDPSQNQVFVATQGHADVLVSDQNGPIKSGDFVTISALDGVGMKGDRNEELVLGKALTGFAGGGDRASTASIKLPSGVAKELGLKRITVDISVSRNPIYSGDSVAGVPSILSKTARLVSSKPITAIRIYACLGILLLALIVGGMIIYSGVHTGMHAVGRNPLAKKAIFRSLITVTLMALIVVTIGLIAVYLLLRV